MNETVAQLITDNLGNLTHPDGATVQSVYGKSDTLQPGMQEMVKRAGTRLGAAITHTVEAHGWSFIRNDELTDLRNRAAAVDPTKPVRIVCNACSGELFTLNLTDPTQASVSGAALRTYFRAESTDGCACT